jgi:hypothetical protein
MRSEIATETAPPTGPDRSGTAETGQGPVQTAIDRSETGAETGPPSPQTGPRPEGTGQTAPVDRWWTGLLGRADRSTPRHLRETAQTAPVSPAQTGLPPGRPVGTGPRLRVTPGLPVQTAPGRARLTGLTAGRGWAARAGVVCLAVVIALLLASVVTAPTALSSQDLLHWARDPIKGLGLRGVWPWVAFYALDAVAVANVLLGVYASWWKGESPGAFRWFVWGFAALSAYANYQFAQVPGSPASREWFFPAMSLLGPAVLEVVLHRMRRWVNEGGGRRAGRRVQFPLTDWLPVTGVFRETFGAWRLSGFLDLAVNPDGSPFVGNLPARARFVYRVLCPEGELRVLRRLRAQQWAALDGVDITLPGLVPAGIVAETTQTGETAGETRSETGLETGLPAAVYPPQAGLPGAGDRPDLVRSTPTDRSGTAEQTGETAQETGLQTAQTGLPSGLLPPIPDNQTTHLRKIMEVRRDWHIAMSMPPRHPDTITTATIKSITGLAGKPTLCALRTTLLALATDPVAAERAVGAHTEGARS